MTDRFAIYHNIPKASDIKIHHIDCVAYARRDPLAENSDWHATPDLKSAISTAQRLAREYSMAYRDCRWCKPSGTVDAKFPTAQKTTKTC